MPSISKIKLEGVSYDIKDSTATTAIEELQTKVGVLAYQNEWIGSIASVTAGNEQAALSDFVQNTVGRAPRQGDEVTITDRQEIWYYNGTSWIVFMSSTELTDATSSSKGVMQVGTGLSASNGVVSVSRPVPTGGSNGQVLSVNSSGALTWTTPATGTDIVVSATQPTNQKAGDLWFQIVG